MYRTFCTCPTAMRFFLVNLTVRTGQLFLIVSQILEMMGFIVGLLARGPCAFGMDLLH